MITKDLVESLERKFSIPLNDSSREEIRFLEDGFLFSFCKPRSASSLVAFEAKDLSDELKARSSGCGLPVVSFDRVYLDSEKYVEPSRIMDQYTGEVTIGPRYGTPPLKRQIENLRGLGEIAIVDSGAMEGNTLLFMLNMMRSLGVNVRKVFLGVSSRKAMERVGEKTQIDVVLNPDIYDIYEWIELRDFFAIDGRAVQPANRTKRFIPYYENLGEWASIEEEKIDSVSELCKRYNGKLMRILRRDCNSLQSLGSATKMRRG